MQITWDGPDSTNRSSCPCDVEFEIKPGLAKSLNSLESGRIIMTVKLCDTNPVTRVWAELVNNARSRRTDYSAEQSKGMTSISANLSMSDTNDVWKGELSIPAVWIEGASASYERTGSFTQIQSDAIFSLFITYQLRGDIHCTAHFASQDAFHWSASQ